METRVTVADAMTTKPVTVHPGISIQDASSVMKQAGVGSLLIVDELMRVLGIITAEDVVYRVAAVGKDAASTMIEAVMTKEIVDIRPEADIYDAMVVMRENDIFHLPVRDAHQKLIGFLTLKDVLKIEPQLFDIMEEMAELNAAQKPHPEEFEGYCVECGNFAKLTRVQGKSVCTYCQDF